jgi:homoserine kinase type II
MAGEAAAVCAHYDLGVVHSVHRYRRGSGHSPKVLLQTSRGLFLLKRRAAAGPARGAAADPHRVAVSHQAQIHLAAHGFPVPRLVGTRADNNSMVQVGDRVYEVYEFVRGEPYDRSVEATTSAGATLGWYHRLMARFVPAWELRPTSFHAIPAMAARLERAAAERGGGRAGRAAAGQLADLYSLAAARADALGAPAWPTQIIHGDWHAGNLLFRDRRVVAVVDHDTIGRGPRLLDAANGALQFSLVRPGDAPAPPSASASPAGSAGHDDAWPVEADLARLAAFCAGYHAQSGTPAGADFDALPWLMIEALATEAVAALRNMGRSHLLDAAGLLRMVAAKARWLADHADEISLLASPHRA